MADLLHHFCSCLLCIMLCHQRWQSVHIQSVLSATVGMNLVKTLKYLLGEILFIIGIWVRNTYRNTNKILCLERERNLNACMHTHNHVHPYIDIHITHTLSLSLSVIHVRVNSKWTCNTVEKLGAKYHFSDKEIYLLWTVDVNMCETDLDKKKPETRPGSKGGHGVQGQRPDGGFRETKPLHCKGFITIFKAFGRLSWQLDSHKTGTNPALFWSYFLLLFSV